MSVLHNHKAEHHYTREMKNGNPSCYPSFSFVKILSTLIPNLFSIDSWEISSHSAAFS